MKKQKLKRNKGITLIALVVTIIVLLILAGISIQMLVGEGGILTNAREARDKTGEADAKEELNMYLMEYALNKNLGDTTELKAFLESKGYTVKDTEDGKLEVEKDGYKFIVDPETLSVTLKEKGVPEISFEVSEQDEDGKVTVTVTVTNKDELNSIDDITVTAPDGTNIEGTVDKDAGTATFKVDKNGNYELEVTATTEGKEKTTKSTVKVDKITAEITETLGYGTIDVIWVDKNNTVDEFEEPKVLDGMKKVAWTWNEDTKTWIEKEEEPRTNEEWYSYRTLEEGSKDDNKGEEGSHWANAKNTDGSYFVWVPRYAYRIKYYKDQSAYEKGEKPLAYYDGNGLVNPDGTKIGKLNGVTIENKMDEKIQTVTKDEKSYIVHPAFYGPGSEDLGGGFGTDKGITGIWVAKYEMSKEISEDGLTWNYEITHNTSRGNLLTENAGNQSLPKIRVVSKPAGDLTINGIKETDDRASWRYTTIENMYTNLLKYDEDKESHLMKNSEWGACSYLAHSQYGRNGHKITINNSSSYYTGNAGNTVNAEYATGKTNYYYTEAGGLASTAGNVYGIYDINGGAYDMVAAFNAEGGINLRTYGGSMLNDTKTSTKYATAYYNSSSSDSGTTVDNYRIGKVGDATKEVSTGGVSGNKNHWFSCMSLFPDTNNPFFLRGNLYSSYTSGSIFSLHHGDGLKYIRDYAYRVVLVAE